MSDVLFPCGGCGSITVQCQTASVSVSKCGFDEYGTPSSPPKIYRTRTLSGTMNITRSFAGGSPCSGACASTDVVTFTGACTYSRLACSLTTGGNMEIVSDIPCGTLFSDTNTAGCTVNVVQISGGTSYSASSTTVLTGTGGGCAANNIDFYSGTVTETLSNEYTTLDLYNDAVTALGSATFSSLGSCAGLTADYVLSSDAKSILLSDVNYWVTFPAVPAGMSLYYDIYLNGIFQTTINQPLPAAQTLWIVGLSGSFDSFPGTSNSGYIDNFRIACSA